MIRGCDVAEDDRLASAPRQNQSARLGAVFDLKVALRSLRQRWIRRIEHLVRKFERQFVTQVTGAKRGSASWAFASVPPSVSLCSRSSFKIAVAIPPLSTLFDQIVKPISGALQ